MKSDRELLELAAKAAGITEFSEVSFLSKGYRALINGAWLQWNPLTDNGDALRLALKLRLRIDYVGDQACVEGVLCSGATPEESARHAIVRAAAAIGEKMP